MRYFTAYNGCQTVQNVDILVKEQDHPALVVPLLTVVVQWLNPLMRSDEQKLRKKTSYTCVPLTLANAQAYILIKFPPR